MTEQYLHSFITDLKNEWIPIKEAELEKNRRENHHYNPLRTISIKETDHSRILGELLNPDGSHGKGTLFLHSFLEAIEIDQPMAGTWRVTVEKGRIDILLRRDSPASVVIIENKANSAIDQQQQLYRYWLQEIYGYYPALDYDTPQTTSRFKIIYAPARAYEKPSTISLKRPEHINGAPKAFETLPLPITYFSFNRDIAPWLEAMVTKVESPRLEAFLKLYAEIWRI